jgi:hypothetical protein
MTLYFCYYFQILNNKTIYLFSLKLVAILMYVLAVVSVIENSTLQYFEKVV